MIKLILSAPVHEMAEAFKRVFANADNVDVVEKTFEAIPEFDCMVSAANSFGLMDGGVDAAITAFFGTQLQTRVQNHILREYLGEQPVGTAFVIETGDNNHPWLVHAPTMRVPLTIDGTDAVYNATWAALLAIFQHNKNATTDRKIKTVVFPAMGAGCGQVPFESVARQMKQAWDNFNKKTEAINWEYAHSRQLAVFNTCAYCPGTPVCRYADIKYIGLGDYRTYCLRSGQVCINPEHQVDDVLTNNRSRPGAHMHQINPVKSVGNIAIGAHSHGRNITIGAHSHTPHKQ
ncbi:macro domain-containing protein [Escherichia coli]|uniref:macro domain-containing protein n=1 Tax=Escherichia TaxID=561 RepID=UPI0007431B5A|nr:MULTISPECIES: macro domain-containing protein [Escherichia]EFO1266405.1 phage tail protein [Escherichia albertii]EGM8070905.1 phage tail protein [Escherichia albertii]MCU7268394.1 macro domain-containing protein [Escherichia albertii]MCU7287144.1 macro domain-containing protein [Escherichia albertii]MCU7324572.1 macro domain-containing protein [Escherichia albertii]